jgi:TonB-dependent receptor
MKKAIFFFLILASAVAFSQNGTLRGSVIDSETGETIIGANVLLKGTYIGTVTDLDGQFLLELPVGIHDIQISYITYATITIEGVEIKNKEVKFLNNIAITSEEQQLAEVIITAEAASNTEAALLVVKKKASIMLDGISAEKIKLTGDGTAAEVAKRVTGVSIEGGKYVYIRGLGDRYTKTTLNGSEIPGLDPDRNSLQMDIFPSNQIKSIVVSKNFTADLPADFTGGLLNIETVDFPDEKVVSFSFGTSFNPYVHLNSDFLSYEGGNLDFLGFDDGTRALPAGAESNNIPTPISGASPEDVNAFVRSFNPTLAATQQTSLLDFSGSFSIGNMIDLNKGGSESRKLGYMASLSYKSEYRFYNEAFFGEYQRYTNPDSLNMRFATTQDGQLGEQSVLAGALLGIAYKTDLSKLKLTVMHLQNGENRAGKFAIVNDGAAVGQSGYLAFSDNLEYNQRSLTNIFVGGTHVFPEKRFELEWKISPTLSYSNDPDIRKTAFSYDPNTDIYLFQAGNGGNPSRIWRELSEINLPSYLDGTYKHQLFNEDAKFKAGLSYIYKTRDYQILSYDVQFFGLQSPWEPDASQVLDPINLFPSSINNIYYQSGNVTPNPNQYNANISNLGAYVTEEFMPLKNLKLILGVRMEDYAQRHTGRDQAYASGDTINGRNLENEVVLSSTRLFPSSSLIFYATEKQNVRAAYSRTIARPSFKELSFAQILDPVTNRFFNGSFFKYNDWDGELVETNINNYDLRWEYFLERGQIISVSAFYKQFENPIELVRIAEQQTTTEIQPRNVGQGSVLGMEFELIKNLGFIAAALHNFTLNANMTIVQSAIDMTDNEFNSRKGFERTGETIDNTRPMAGQAPYFINAGLVYSSNDLGMDIGLFYNVKGPTLALVGLGLVPDVYMEPFHSLNFSLFKALSEKATIDFKVANMLNDNIDQVYKSFGAEDEFFTSLNPGVSFSLGISYQF